METPDQFLNRILDAANEVLELDEINMCKYSLGVSVGFVSRDFEFSLLSDRLYGLDYAKTVELLRTTYETRKENRTLRDKLDAEFRI